MPGLGMPLSRSKVRATPRIGNSGDIAASCVQGTAGVGQGQPEIALGIHSACSAIGRVHHV